MITKILGYENRRDSNHDELRGMVRQLREKGVEIRMLPTSGCYTVHVYHETWHESHYGPTAVKFALGKVLGRLEAVAQ